MRLRRTCRNIREDLAEEFMFFAKACISMRDICDLDVVTYALRSLHSEEQKMMAEHVSHPMLELESCLRTFGHHPAGSLLWCYSGVCATCCDSG